MRFPSKWPIPHSGTDGRTDEERVGWMDGATFEIWIPKREGGEERGELLPSRRTARRERAPPSISGGARKKALRINHHFERLEGNEELLENTSIRQSSFIEAPVRGGLSSPFIMPRSRTHSRGRATSLIKNKGV